MFFDFCVLHAVPGSTLVAFSFATGKNKSFVQLVNLSFGRSSI
jgi:hypothetical protein